MKDKLLDIIKHFGITTQQRKLQEEIFELNEAITTHELKQSVEYEIPLTELIGTKEHIIEELADCYVLLNQFMEYYKIDKEQFQCIYEEKIDRTLDRIKSGYYEKKETK